MAVIRSGQDGPSVTCRHSARARSGSNGYALSRFGARCNAVSGVGGVSPASGRARPPKTSLMSPDRLPARFSACRAHTSCSGSPTAARLITPARARTASTVTSRACSDCWTRSASRCGTSVTMSTWPSVVQTRSKPAPGTRRAEDNLLQMRAADLVPVLRVGGESHPSSAVLALHPGGCERLGLDHRELCLNPRVPLDEGERSGAPRAWCVNNLPMAFAALVAGVAESEVAPEP